MTNTVFYTFSTIAQTLAGAIALLGAFVLYRLQALRSEIERPAEAFGNNYVAGISEGRVREINTAQADNLQNLRDEGQYLEIVRFAIKTPPPSDVAKISPLIRRNINLIDTLFHEFKKWVAI